MLFSEPMIFLMKYLHNIILNYLIHIHIFSYEILKSLDIFISEAEFLVSFCLMSGFYTDLNSWTCKGPL